MVSDSSFCQCLGLEWVRASISRCKSTELEVLVIDMRIPLPLAGETAEQYHQRLVTIGFVPESVSTGQSDIANNSSRLQALQDQLMQAVPDAATIGNIALREKLAILNPVWKTDVFSQTRTRCIDLGLLHVGRGRGGSVSRISPINQQSNESVIEQIIAPAEIPFKSAMDISVLWETSIASFKAGDIPSAIRAWETLADKGVSKAQYNLSLLYFNGQGVGQDGALALKWCQQAAQLGHSKAQYLLGQMYATGKGVDKDDSISQSWYQKSAEAGYADAQFAIGSMLRKSEDADSEQAFKWIKKAAEQGKAAAQLELARMYEGGWGGKNGAGEATQWMRKAAEQGNAEAEAQLGDAYLRGRNVVQDCVEGEKWLRKAVGHGDVESAFSLGWAFDPGNDESSHKKSYEESVKWYRLAANQGELNSFEFLEGIYRSDDLLPKNKAKATKWLLQAAEQGDVVAQYMIASKYEDGEDLSQDYAQAARWYEAAAEQYCSWAQLKMGNFYEEGIGVAQNYDDAAYWYERAVEQKTPKLGMMSAIQGNVRSEAAQSLMALNQKMGKPNIPELEEHSQTLSVVSVETDLEADAEDGDVASQIELADQYREVEGRDADHAKAAHWYRQAAVQGDQHALNCLGIAYLHGEGVPKNMIAGQALFELAILAGSESAAQNLHNSLGGGGKADGVRKLAEQMSKPGKFFEALDKFVAYREARRHPRKPKE